jgi:NTE family protein
MKTNHRTGEIFPRRKKRKIVLALGGGGVRGVSHVGVLEVLEKEGIPVARIVGTSFGAVVGGMYASDPSVSRLRNVLLQFLDGPDFEKTRLDFLRRSLGEGRRYHLVRQIKDFARRGVLFGLSVTRGYFISREEFGRTLSALLPDIDIGETKIPFRCVATDLISGEPAVLDRGGLREAVQASCSVPGVFQPIERGGALLVDGGWVGPVPVGPARVDPAELVIGVDSSEDLSFPREYGSGLQLVVRSHDISKRCLNRVLLRRADLVIRPEIGDIHWTHFAKAPDCIERGREAGVRALPEILKALSEGPDAGRGVPPRRGNQRD